MDIIVLSFVKTMFRKQNEGVNTRNSTLKLFNIPLKKVKLRETKFNLEVLFDIISLDYSECYLIM